MVSQSSFEQNISALAQGNAPVLETLAQVTMDSLERWGPGEEMQDTLVMVVPAVQCGRSFGVLEDGTWPLTRRTAG
ncbi:MAG: hypothetical protein JO057_31210 [Chloroflexi bacterium]|nr:hypothetical protein [Chloroflexota bacterium]